jgi:hypothetical protein
MGQLDSNVQSPTAEGLGCTSTSPRGVAVQVAFESKGLQPAFHFVGSRFRPGALRGNLAMGSGGVNVHRPTSA